MEPGHLPPQVPLLEIDGLNIVQSGAIVRYIGRKCNLDGGSVEQKMKVDVVGLTARRSSGTLNTGLLQAVPVTIMRYQLKLLNAHHDDHSICTGFFKFHPFFSVVISLPLELSIFLSLGNRMVSHPFRFIPHRSFFFKFSLVYESFKFGFHANHARL